LSAATDIIAKLATADSGVKWDVYQWLTRELNGTQPSLAPTHQSNGKPGLLYPDQLAQALGVRRSKVMTMARQGVIPSRKLGKYVRFDLDDVQAALRAVDNF
jgi:excisionase family DNA binding protein